MEPAAATERLLATIAAACDPAADFPEQLSSTLAAVFALLASEPTLARLLCIGPCSGDELPVGERPRWQNRCAERLRYAAQSSPGVSTPPLFLEPLLLDEVCWQISGRLLAGEAEQLPALLPDLLDSMLAYYVDPEEASRVVAAARAGVRPPRCGG
jgi:hypothetical protein